MFRKCRLEYSGSGGTLVWGCRQRLVALMYLVFSGMPHEIYCRWLGSLLLFSCHVFPVVISPWYNRTGWLGVKKQFTCLSLALALCLCLCVSVSLYFSVCLCLSACLSLSLSVCLPVCLSLSLSLSVCLSVCLSVSVSVSVSVSLCLCLSLSLDVIQIIRIRSIL